MRRVDDRQPAGEHPAGAGRRARRCPSTTAVISRLETRTSTRRPANAGVDRVVVAIDPHQRLGRHPDAPGGGQCRASAPATAASARAPRPAARPGPPGWCDAPGRWPSPSTRRAGPGSPVVGEHAAGLEVGAHEPVRTLQHALGLRITRLAGSPTRPTADRRTRRTLQSDGRPRRSPPRDPTPASPATPPTGVRLRARPHRMSGASLLKISVPAIARDQHTSQVTTQPRRRAAHDPTGMCSPGSHRSHCTSSPGR